MASISLRVTRALQWHFALSVVTIGMQFGTTAIVARLLTPTDFGIYALASVVLVLARHLGDRGLLSAIVREPVVDPQIIGSAVALSCLLSFGMALIIGGLVPLAGLAFADAHNGLAWHLLQLMSVSIIIAGVGAPAQALMERELRFRELGLRQFAGVILGTGVVTISLAAAGKGAWSLAYGDVVNTAVVSGACWWTMRDRWTVSWNTRHVLRIGVIGVQMTVLRVLDVLWTQVPLLVANIYLPAFDVGLYQRSQTLVDLGISYTTGRVGLVMFPVLAARQDRIELLRELMPPFVALYSLVLLPAAAFVAIAAPDVIQFVLGPGWEGAARPLALIMLAFAILHVSQPASSQLEARAVFAPRMLGAGIGAAILALCSVVLVGSYGLVGIALAAVISASFTAAIHFIASVWYFGVRPYQIVRWLTSSAILAGVMACAMAICQSTVLQDTRSSTLRLSVMGLTAGLTLIVTFRLLIGKAGRYDLAKHLPPHVSSSSIARFLGLRFVGC